MELECFAGGEDDGLFGEITVVWIVETIYILSGKAYQA
jgi:hypothetical protein